MTQAKDSSVDQEPRINFDDWDHYFLAIAETVAQKSKDPRCKVGAVIVSPDKLVLHTALSRGDVNYSVQWIFRNLRKRSPPSPVDTEHRRTLYRQCPTPPARILQLPLDPRCDLFSLGVVMYEMATGRLPFSGASPAETATNILDKEAGTVDRSLAASIQAARADCREADREARR